ncbi:OPT family small oligopeptide transporter [Kwoniella shandongensis]|uniref:OPT family small oligopeptide transporter n=1 Tax=Kwoniella shandongensis TaxID=1734106 RepID=A0A5M6BU87_9TREE|nr:OPT family small oligopeptide transporter [Kwoniella shandongensis]KAA5526414.1 OPT family small oligopeptide transporter [Kwoniella shandongensis]
MSDPTPPPPPPEELPSDRPSTSAGKRPRTGPGRRRAPPTARVGTAMSYLTEDELKDLPDQQFYPEGEEDEEDYDDEEDEEEEDEEVFAFHRPVTGAVPPAPLSDFSSSAPNTGLSSARPRTGTTGPTTGQNSLRDTPMSPNLNDSVPTPTGVIDVGGHLPQLTYDKNHPPPLSGRYNPNNSVFAFSASSKSDSRPNTGRSRRVGTGASSFAGRMHLRRPPGTGTTNLTSTTELTSGMSDVSYDSGVSDGTSAPGNRSKGNRRVASSSLLIPESEAQSEAGTRRGYSRGSYGMTEMTGDMTVADGKTTWGDGLGGVKEGSEEGDDSMAGVDMDMIEEDSPYPEVRVSVSNIDDPEMPALTLRAWVLGLLFTVLASGANTFFHFRNPAPFITPLIIQVLVYPIGKLCAWILPITTYHLPSWMGGGEWSFNPGPFNIKEHTIIVIMANVAIGPAYGLYATVSSELYYNHNFGYGFAILFVLATQITGFTMAGISRRFVVWPASMIWPQNLVIATNLNTFHAEEDGFTGGMSRFRFLIIAGIGAFVWYFVPGFLFTALSYFSYACWIAPSNPVVNQLFGVSTGLGMGIFNFDWTQIAFIGSPLAAPWWAEVNIGLGFCFFYWILVPIFYYTNVWQTAYLPINVIQAADRFGTAYDIFQILNPDITLNTTAYAAYSPVYLSATFSMTFMLAFALSTSLLVHTALYHGPRIWRAIRNIKTEADDIHMKLMRQYPEVPDWWFLVLLVVVLVFGIVTIEVYHTGLPVWGYLISILLPFVYLVPSAFIFAMTSQMIGINLLAELIPGFMFKGRPIPSMIFKCFSVQTLISGINFVQDQKLGHYMKIPPRATFVAQLSATAVACFVQTGTKELLFRTISDICAPRQRSLLNCASTKTFFTSTIIWGLIGPDRLFSKGSMYYPQVYAALVGAVLPIPLWLYVRKNPRSWLRNLNLPVIFNGGLSIPPATGINYSSWFAVGFVFQFWIRRKQFAWWSKYNYVLSAALDVGTALSAIAIFLVLDTPGASLSWWGNDVYTKTADWNGVDASYLPVPSTGFGPDTWKI